jgi:hypothetical protein
MNTKLFVTGVSLLLVLVAHTSNAQQPGPESEHSVVFELGGAFAKDLSTGAWQSGGTLAFEVTPIEGRLELEFGASAMRASGRTEASADVLFKKPYRLSAKAELMIGLGPEIVRSGSRTSLGAEAALDFMFWPYKQKDVGWYLEPGYELVFGHGTSRALNLSGGLLIGWR